MSTILDALRKVEQDHQAQNTDVRARLLRLPPRPHSRAPQKKLPPWLVSLGLAVAGFLIGAGIIMYRSSPSAQSRETAAKTSPDKLAAAPVVADTPPAQPAAELPAQPFVPTPTSQEQSAPAVASVQRSPFISRPSSEPSKSAYAAGSAGSAGSARSVRPATSPAASQAEGIDDEYIVELLPQDLWDDENETLAPEDEAHFVSPSSAPFPSSVISSAPPVPPVRPAPPAPPAHFDASLSLIQWSTEATQRFVSIKVADGPLSMVYEGDSVGGFTIVKIHKNKVDLRSNDADGADLTLHLR